MRPGSDDGGTRPPYARSTMSHERTPSGPAGDEGPVPVRRALGLQADLVADVVTGTTEAAVGPVGRAPVWLRLPSRSWVRLVVLVAVGALCLGVYLAALEQLVSLGVGGLAAPMVAAVQTLPLLLVGVGPILAWRWLTIGLLAGSVLTPGGQDWTWPVTSMVLLAVLLYLVATTHPRRVVVGTWVLTVLVVLAPASWLKDVPAVVTVVLSAVAALVLLLGDTVRDRGTVRSRLASATAQRQEDLAQQAVLEERSHIARELHDVVAHHMSMIAVQAEAAPLRYPDLSPDVARTFAVIRDASREALGEMRRVVGALRSEEERGERTPQPGTDQLPALVEASRRAGMGVDLEVSGATRPLPPAVDISAYRVVQEALSNSRRHAPGAAVRVVLRFDPDRLLVRVTDDGAAGASP